MEAVALLTLDEDLSVKNAINITEGFIHKGLLDPVGGK